MRVLPLMVRSAASRASRTMRPRCSSRLILRPHLFDFRIARLIVRALAVDGIDHHALAVLQCGLADEGAQRRLVVDLAESDLAKWRGQRQPFRSRRSEE